MATTNPNVDAIVGYVDQQRVPLIGKSVLGAKAPQYFTLMTGVKGTTALNIMNADPALQCGNACGFTPENDTTFTQREMEAIPFKVDMTFCDKNLLDTWANYEVKVAAGIKTLPFEEEWTGQIVAKVQDQLEKFIWVGGQYCEKTVKGIEGILNTENGIKVTAADGDSIYTKLVELYLALPEAVQAAQTSTSVQICVAILRCSISGILKIIVSSAWLLNSWQVLKLHSPMKQVFS